MISLSEEILKSQFFFSHDQDNKECEVDASTARLSDFEKYVRSAGWRFNGHTQQRYNGGGKVRQTLIVDGAKA